MTDDEFYQTLRRLDSLNKIGYDAGSAEEQEVEWLNLKVDLYEEQLIAEPQEALDKTRTNCYTVDNKK